MTDQIPTARKARDQLRDLVAAEPPADLTPAQRKATLDAIRRLIPSLAPLADELEAVAAL